jgi:flagellar basal-body rod protein FlgF/flagellar basal-body rod protein FlgG
MNTGLYAACAGLLARTQALDSAAHNLANLNTSGYKAQTPTFHSVLAAADNQAAGPIADAIHTFGVLGGERTDMAQGTLEQTGSDSDFALQGDGWFVVQSGSERLYTRNGNFHVDRQSHLATADGKPVVGAQGPILVPPGKLSVSANGTISVNGAVAGQLKVVQFADPSALTAQGSSYFSAAAGSERPSTAGIVQGSLEGSNVNGIAAGVGLVALQRNAEFLQQALTVFHSNFNRIAAQDLSRI